MGGPSHRRHLQGEDSGGSRGAGAHRARRYAHAWVPLHRQPWVHSRAGTLLCSLLCRQSADHTAYRQNDRIFDIADVAFSQVSDEEKKQHAGNIMETGLYSGYKLRQYWVSYPLRPPRSQGSLLVVSLAHRQRRPGPDRALQQCVSFMSSNGSVLNSTMCSVVHPHVYDRQEYPKSLRLFLPEIRAWTEHNHYNILHPILRYRAVPSVLCDGIVDAFTGSLRLVWSCPKKHSSTSTTSMLPVRPGVRHALRIPHPRSKLISFSARFMK